jgi:Domain of unknown function (DUF4926)
MTVLPEYSDVILTVPYRREGKNTIPKGATGTIVEIYPKLHAYTVEFAEPCSCVETVAMTMVAPIAHG